MLTKGLNDITGLSSQPIEGAMYASPQIAMPMRAQSEALLRRIPADDFWCLELVEQTGIVCVPGSGFGQQKRTRMAAQAAGFKGDGSVPAPPGPCDCSASPARSV